MRHSRKFYAANRKKLVKSNQLFCVYCLIDSDKRVKYIGVTRYPEKRLASHRKDERKAGFDMKILRSGLNEARAARIERVLISILKKPCGLLNRHTGGAGFFSVRKSGFRVTVQTFDGLRVLRIDALRMENGKLSVSPTLAGRKVAAVLQHYQAA